MKNSLRILLPLFGFLTFAGISASRVGAATTTQPTGITVTPAFQQVSIQASEAKHPINFSVTNNRATPQTLDLTAVDFNTLNESGGLFFVGTNPTALQKKYGLAQWFSLPQKQITIGSKQTVTINAEILNLADMSAGGHYGALNLAIAGVGQNKSGNNIALHPVASSLLFVTKLGGDTHKLGLQSVSAKHSPFGLPGSVNLRFHNNGNTHLIPRGTVTITNAQGKLVSKGIINDDSGIILPETFRQYYVPLQKIMTAHTPGAYKLHVDFRFDGISQFRTYEQSFMYIPLTFILIIAIVLAGLTYGAIKLVKRHRSKNE